VGVDVGRRRVRGVLDFGRDAQRVVVVYRMPTSIGFALDAGVPVKLGCVETPPPCVPAAADDFPPLLEQAASASVALSALIATVVIGPRRGRPGRML